MGVAAIVLIALVVAAMLGAGIFLIFRQNSSGEDDEDEEEIEEGSGISIQEPLAEQITRVTSHQELPPGGSYDSSTGTTWYILPDGSKWWMQEDESFLLYQNENVAENKD